MPIHALLTGSSKDKARIKSREIAKIPLVGEYVHNGYRIEIQSMEQMDDGIEVFARAWKGNDPVGFVDGTVEIERFRIYNPPILVDDPSGEIVREWTDIDGETRQRKLKEDPLRAIRETLAHSIHVTAKGGEKIIKGKVGNTTSTFFSDLGGDGITQGTSLTYATAGTTGTSVFSNVTDNLAGQQYHFTTGNYFRWRGWLPFDTSSLPDGDTVSAAVLSVFGMAGSTNDTVGVTPSLQVVSSSQASNTALATTDHNLCGTTVFATITWGSYNTSAYNNFTLDANGIAQISKTGFSKFTMRTNRDISGTAPSTAGNNLERFQFNSADESGTSSDPKLVITHAAPAAGNRFFLLLGVGT